MGSPGQRTVVQMMDFVPNNPGRSMDRFFLKFAEQLLARGWTTTYVFPADPAPFFQEKVRELGLVYDLMPFQPTVRAALAMGLRLRARHRPDVIQTHSMSKFHPAIPVVKTSSGASVLVTTDHSSGSIRSRSRAGEVVVRARGLYARTYTDYVVAVSDFVRRRDVERMHLSPTTTRTIYNGVDLTFFPPTARVPNAVPTVAYAGQLIPEKGIKTLLLAMAEMTDAGHPPFRLRIAGAGGQEAELREIVRDRDLSERVEFLGQISWVPELFSSADVVVVPSEWQEAFGVTVVEAMASGSCLLASDAGAIPEVVGPEGSAGCIFRSGDRSDLKAKLAGLLADPDRRERLRVAGRKRVEEAFSLETMLRGYLTLFEEIGARSGLAHKGYGRS